MKSIIHPARTYRGARVLVTGAGGFIGLHLARRLAEAGATVYGADRLPRPRGLPVARWFRADVAEAGPADRLFVRARPEFVFHLASHVTGTRDIGAVLPCLRSNLASTVNLLVAAARHGVKRFVLAGSLEEADGGGAPAVPSSPYAASKSAATLYARMFHALYGVPVVLARLFMVYGPGQRDRTKIVPYVSLALARGERPRLSSGRRPVDWIYVGDVVEALLALGIGPALEGGRFDVGSGRLVTVRSVASRLARLSATGVRPEFGALPDRPMEQVRRADARATSRATGWRARTSLAEGLKRTYAWYAERV